MDTVDNLLCQVVDELHPSEVSRHLTSSLEGLASGSRGRPVPN